jgi:putative sigma-54 modulation protein
LKVRQGNTPKRIHSAAKRGLHHQRRRTMQFQLSGQQIEVTPALRQHVESRLDRLQRLDDKLISLAVILSVDKLRHRADATLGVTGATLHAEGAEADMYASIDAMFDKLVNQLRRHREKIADKHQRDVREERQYG